MIIHITARPRQHSRRSQFACGRYVMSWPMLRFSIPCPLWSCFFFFSSAVTRELDWPMIRWPQWAALSGEYFKLALARCAPLAPGAARHSPEMPELVPLVFGTNSSKMVPPSPARPQPRISDLQLWRIGPGHKRDCREKTIRGQRAAKTPPKLYKDVFWQPSPPCPRHVTIRGGSRCAPKICPRRWLP